MGNGASSGGRIARAQVNYFHSLSLLYKEANNSHSEATTSLPQVVQRAPEQLTQRQRQNARRNQLLKAAKAEAEAERLAKLAERRRALERERIIEQSRRGASKATVDSRGKLVYE
jgi:hypothetical protein